MKLRLTRPAWVPTMPALAALAVGVIALALAPARAALAEGRPGPTVRIRGGAEIHAVATIARDELTLHGELIDDTGTPIAKAPVGVKIAGDDGRALTSLRACTELTDARPSKPSPAPRGGELTIETDDRGGFCWIGRALLAPKASLTLRFAGKGLYDATEATVNVEAAEEHRTRTVVRFEPAVETLDLDRDSVLFTASLRIDRSDTGRAPTLVGSAQRANLPLVLTDERGVRLGEAVTGGDGRARFEVKTSAFAGPGDGELTVSFAGNPVLETARWSQPVMRRAEASLAVAAPISPADPEDGVAIDLSVNTTRGAVSGGVVEVQHLRANTPSDEETGIGAAPVDDAGHARVLATFPGAGASRARLRLRYLPAAPWYRAGPALEVEVPLERPSVGRSVLLAALVLAAAVWVVLGWRRAPPRPIEAEEDAAADLAGVARVRVVGPREKASGWSGKVIDAHDGSPVPRARISVVRPSFSDDGVVIDLETDDHGAFEIRPINVSDARLVVEAEQHVRLDQAMPPEGVLSIAVIARRRALLDRLVKWARGRGLPFDAQPEPTPGHVRRVATRGEDAALATWASRTEEAVYGPASVDGSVEREIREREPRAHG